MIYDDLSVKTTRCTVGSPLGHSKGANVVLAFLQNMDQFSWEGTERPKNAIILDAPSASFLYNNLSRDIAFIARTTPVYRYVPKTTTKVVNVLGVFDPVNNFTEGVVVGAINKWDIWGSGFDFHSLKTQFANEILNQMLQVQYDHGARDK